MRLLDEIMIRRTRQFIVDNYPETTINGRPVPAFPKEGFARWSCSLTALFGDQIYKKVLDTIEESAPCALPGRLPTSRRMEDKSPRKEATLRAELQKFGLLKRFESSVEAIRTSINRLVKFYEYFEKTLASGKILKSHAFQKALSQIGSSLEGTKRHSLRKLRNDRTRPTLTAEYDRILR